MSDNWGRSRSLHRTERLAPLAQENRVFPHEVVDHESARLAPLLALRVVLRQRRRRPQPLRFLALFRRFHHRPQLVQQFVLVRGQGVTDHRHFVRVGVEQPTVEVIDLARRPPAAGPGWRAVACAVVVLLRLGLGFVQQRVEPAAIRRPCPARWSALAPCRHRAAVHASAWAFSCAVTLVTAPADAGPARTATTSPAPHDTGPPWPIIFRCGGVQFFFGVSQRMLQPLRQRRQLPVLRAGVPDRRPIRQQQFGPAPPRLLLLAGQPVPQRRHQVVVGQLVVFLPRLRPADVVPPPSLLAFRVGRRDEPDFAVENAEQVVEVLGTAGVARRLQQLLLRPHVALDVGARLRAAGLSGPPGPLSGASGVAAGRSAALNVSSRKVTPTPSVPPTSFSVAGVHGLPLTISANRASRTEMTLPSWASPATA